MITEQTIQRFNNRDEAAFRVIFNDLYPGLVLFATKMIKDYHESEDLVINAFYKLWRGRSKFNTYKPLKDFLFTSVKRACFNYTESFRKKLRFGHVDLEEDICNDGSLLSDEDYGSIYAEVMYRYLDTLPSRQREAVRLMLLGYKDKEISIMLQQKHTTIEQHRHKFIKSVKRLFNINFNSNDTAQTEN